MNKFRTIMIYLLILLTSYIVADDLSDYSAKLIRKIAVGKNAGEIGYEPSVAGSPSSPYTFAISKNNEIIIPDIINNRMNIYGLGLNYFRSINNIGDCRYAREIKIDDDYIYCLMGSKMGIKKIDSKGKLIYHIDGYSLPENVRNRRNFYIIDNKLFFYDDEDNIKSLTEEGKIEDPLKTKTILADLNRQKSNSKNYLDEIGLTKQNIILFDKIKQESGFLFEGSKFYNSDFQKVDDYFRDLEPIRKAIKAPKTKESDRKMFKCEIDLNKLGGLFLFGYDKDHNSYWRSSVPRSDKSYQTIFIFSEFGELIDAFYYGVFKKQGFFYLNDRSEYQTTGTGLAVSWDGDIYFMSSPEDEAYMYKNKDTKLKYQLETKYCFYKLSRQW